MEEGGKLTYSKSDLVLESDHKRLGQLLQSGSVQRHIRKTVLVDVAKGSQIRQEAPPPKTISLAQSVLLGQHSR